MNAIINTGKVCILELDIDGAKTIHEAHPDWKFIFLRPRTIEICE